MADNELVIRIAAETTKFTDALEKAQKQTEDLEGVLSKTAKISGIAFAALTAEVGLATHAYAESEAANLKLTQALQNQGIYSKALADSYRSQAAELQKKTGIDDDAIVKGQALLQGMIGQRAITLELTQAVLDLSKQMGGDLDGAFAAVGKGINGNTVGLKKLGIEIDEHLTKEEKTAKIIEIVTQRFGGQAEAANKGLGSINGLKSAFSDLQEEIGGRFAPAITLIIRNMTSFFETLSGNKQVMDLAFSLGVAGLAVSGIGVVAGVAGLAFLKFRAAMIAAEISTTAMSVAVKGLIGATGIGLLVVIASEVYLNWSSIFPRVQAIFKAFVDNIGSLGTGLATLLRGVFTLDGAKLKEGLDQIKNAFTAGYAEYVEVVKTGEAKIAQEKEKSQVTQNASQKAAADKAAEDEAERAAMKLAVLQAQNELIRLESDRASKEVIDLKKQEIEILTQIQDEKNSAVRDSLVAHLEEIRMLEDEATALSLDQQAIFQQSIIAKNDEFNKLSDKQKQTYLIKHKAELKAEIQTEATTKQLAADAEFKEEIANHNRFLADQQRFGTAYALINKMMHSSIYTGSKQAFGELAQLTQSSNATLKGIGKIAAIANIVIKTAESAMNIYQGFSIIPFIGPALGIAGAAAAVMFGAEQIGKVQGAAKGGLMVGGIPGMDSIPVMAQHGELIAPSQNFEEVIGSVRAQREARRFTGEEGGSAFGGGGGVSTIVLELKDELMDFIEAKLVERGRLNLSLQGSSA